MMDCDTTGIEPDIALVKYKKLVGGGVIKIVNQSVPGVLQKLGYTPIQVEDMLRYVDEKEMIERAPHLKDEHLAEISAINYANGKLNPNAQTRSWYMNKEHALAAAKAGLADLAAVEKEEARAARTARTELFITCGSSKLTRRSGWSIRTFQNHSAHRHQHDSVLPARLFRRPADRQSSSRQLSRRHPPFRADAADP